MSLWESNFTFQYTIVSAGVEGKKLQLFVATQSVSITPSLNFKMSHDQNFMPLDNNEFVNHDIEAIFGAGYLERESRRRGLCLHIP